MNATNNIIPRAAVMVGAAIAFFFGVAHVGPETLALLFTATALGAAALITTRVKGALVLALTVPVFLVSTATANPPAMKPKVAIVIVDDVSGPTELAQHGVVPLSALSFEPLLDAVAESGQVALVGYLVVREKAERNVPVTAQVMPFRQAAPVRPADANLSLAELDAALVQYRKQDAIYQRALVAHRQESAEMRERFARAAMAAQGAADAERTSLAASSGSFAASDVAGAMLAAVELIRNSGATYGVIIANSDLADMVRWRKPRERAFTAEEMPASLVRTIVFVNSSLKPDASPLFKGLPIERVHANTFANAVDFIQAHLASIPTPAGVAAPSAGVSPPVP